ncbi:MAG: Na+/H+ antiporter NhaA [Actinomycetota bacterium]|nr:Na+/H+ antiporter NhaA [Actinomycetota bacterium]
MSLPTDTKNALFSRGEWPEAKRVADLLRLETIGGAMLLVAALVAIIWSNTPWDAAYFSLQDFEFGPSSLDLHLSMSHWASDGLLAIFFFTVGLELKHEFLRGDLRDPAKAVVPVIAAACGVVVPAGFYVLVQLISGGGAIDGWAIPTATDIAFAVAVLAVIGTHLPTALRSFLLTLAVVDDLIAITIIAIFFTSTINVWALFGSFAVVILFGLLMRFGVRNPLILVPVGVIAWVLLHASGIHATIAGVLLGLSVPVAYDTAHNLEHRIRPLSAGFCVPVFAFFAAGVNFIDGFADAVTDPVTIGIVVGLICGKTVGIFGSTFVMARFTKAKLDDGIAWSDLFGMSLLAGIGFTVSLLIGELAFGPDSDTDQHVKIGVLVGSLLAALLATAVLRRRNKIYEAAWIEENRDDDHDGIPDIYQQRKRHDYP